MAVGPQAGRDDHGFGDDRAAVADMHVGGVQPDVHEPLMTQVAAPGMAMSASMCLQILDTMDLETPESQPRALTRSSTFFVEVPVA